MAWPSGPGRLPTRELYWGARSETVICPKKFLIFSSALRAAPAHVGEATLRASALRRRFARESCVVRRQSFG